MASTGKLNWTKNFLPIVSSKPVVVPVKPEGVQGYDEQNKPTLKIQGGQQVEVLNEYDEKTNRVAVNYNKKKYRVRLDSLVKPKTSQTGSMLKPTDFKSITASATAASKLADALIEELQDKKDVDASEREYLVQLVQYWSGKTNSTDSLKKSFLTVNPARLLVIQKYFGEVLGALACCARSIVPNVKLTKSSKILFPTRTNEPLVDYYIEDKSLFGGRLSVSAKAESSTSNTVKPENILKLLETSGKKSKYASLPVYKAAEIIRDNSAIAAPFYLYSLVVEKLPREVLEYVKTRSKSFLSSRDYDSALMEVLTSKMPASSAALESQLSRLASGGRVSVASLQKKVKAVGEKPTFGQITAFVEKSALGAMNSQSKYDPSEMFKEAVSGVVVYVKYASGTKSTPQGAFSVPEHEENSQEVKKFKWRSKNYAARFDDKIGVQP